MVVIAVLVTAALAATGFVQAFVPIAIGLTTTALGTLLSILRDNQLLDGRFGELIMAAGAVGEFLPILAIAIFLSLNGAFSGLLSLLIIAVIALIFTFVLLLVLRGLPALIVYRRVLPLRGRVQMTLLTATALPLLVALAHIGLESGTTLPENAAAPT